MSDVEAELRRENAALRQQLADARRGVERAARGEGHVDGGDPASATPLLLQAAQDDLRKSRALLRAVFDGSLDGMLLADDSGVYVDANPAACVLFGVTREQLVGRSVRDFAIAGYDAGASFVSFLATGHATGQFPLRRPDGTVRILDFSAVANVSPGLHLSALRDVTDRVAAEDALRRSEVRFRAMVEKGQDGIALLSAEIREIYQSPAVERLFGYPLGDAQGVPWQDFVDEEERPKLAGALAKLMEGPGASAAVEFRMRRRDGSRCWLDLTATNWLDDPDIGAIVANFRDITERKAFEEEREWFFQLPLVLLCIAGRDGRFRRLNPAWETTLGWSTEELCARPWLDFVHPDDHAATEREAAQLAEGRTVSRFENRYRCKDGSYRCLRWAATSTSSGLFYASAHDVTDERAAAERDRLLFAASPLPMLLVDASTLRILDANDASVTNYGYSRDELLALTLDDIVVEEQRPNLLSGQAELAEGTVSIFVSDRQHQTKSGARRHVQVTSHRVNIHGTAAILKVIVDVTETKRLAEERALYVERLRLLELSVSRLNDIVLITKATPLAEHGPEIVYVNRAFERVTGYSADEAIGKTPRMLQGPDTSRLALARVKAALERAVPVREELVNYTKAGVPYWVELDIAPVRNDAGELSHFVAIQRDTTEQHRARQALLRSEEQMRQAQKMEAIGNLAGGIAHDFNNVLSVILSYTTLLMDGLPNEDDPLRKDLEEVHRAGLRAAAMTRQLLAFSRKQMLQPRVVDVGVVVKDVETMLGRMIGEDIELSIHTAVGAGRVFVDASQLQQVIMNLVVNARDAMPEGGNITIETSSVVLDETYAATHDGVKSGSYVLLAVTDTGTGMDRATQDRIFEPFFTTKEQGKGTGLGLSTVYGIVQQSGGHLWVYSEPGQGTTFKVYLPRTERIEEAAASSQPRDSIRGSETILLVEDDAPVRHVVRRVLGKSGYHVLEAQNAGEALLVSEQFKATIHLLLTDVVMPRMSGPQLADRLAALRPAMKVLFVSGYTENTIVHRGVLDAGVEFLVKPIQPDTLVKKVREVLDATSRRRTLAPG